MEYLRVKNIEKFQQYKDGRPIKWIKIWLTLLDDYKFNKLPEKTQIHLVKIWMYAARNNNKIENDSSWISRRIEAQSKVDLNQLVTEGWLVPYETVRECTESYLEEKRVEEKREDKSEPAVPACPHSQIIDLYHECLPERPAIVRERWGGSTSERELRARWKEHERHRDLEFWRGYFTSVRASDWRMGRDKWKGVDLHWLVKRSNFDKVVQDWMNAA